MVFKQYTPKMCYFIQESVNIKRQCDPAIWGLWWGTADFNLHLFVLSVCATHYVLI